MGCPFTHSFNMWSFQARPKKSVCVRFWHAYVRCLCSSKVCLLHNNNKIWLQCLTLILVELTQLKWWSFHSCFSFFGPYQSYPINAIPSVIFKRWNGMISNFIWNYKRKTNKLNWLLTKTKECCELLFPDFLNSFMPHR